MLTIVALRRPAALAAQAAHSGSPGGLAASCRLDSAFFLRRVLVSWNSLSVIWETVLYQINLFESSRIVSRRYFGGGPSCLVTLMVLDFGRVIYLT